MEKGSLKDVCLALAIGTLAAIAIFHTPLPIDGGDTLHRILVKGADGVVEELLKKGNLLIGTLTGKFDQIHKGVERAVDWIKDNKYNLAGYAGTTAAGEGLSFVYDKLTHVATVPYGEYSVEFVPDDENDQFNIYVNGESCTKLAYEYLKNCSEERISEKLTEAEGNAIEEYKSRHR